MYIRLKMNSNSVRIGFLSWQIFFVLPQRVSNAHLKYKVGYGV